MDLVWFSLGFSAIHLVAYVVAGMVALRLTRDLYTGEGALLTAFLRDVDDPDERRRQGLVMVPAQLARGLLMSVVLYPVVDAVAELGFPLRFGFLAGLMLVFADLASAVPFPNTIEGLVYLQPRFVEADVFWRIQSEAIIYSLLFGGAAAWLLF